MSAPLRAAFIIDRMIAGAGTENQLAFLLERFPSVSVEPHLVCLRDDPGFPRERIRCPVHVLYGQSVLSLSGFRNVRAVARLAREYRWQVLVTFFRDANMLGTLGGKLAGVPVISSRRNMGKNYWHTTRELAVLRGLNRWSAAVVSNSEAVRRYTMEAEGLPGSKIHVIPNAVDLRRFQGAPDPALRASWGAAPGDLVVGCVANLRPIKGVDTLLRAFAPVAEAVAGSRLVLVGEGEEEKRLQELAADLGLGARVRFAGRRENVAPYLASWDVAVLPSLGESSSNALLEYLCAGLPVVATRVGGTPELIEDGTGGLLVPPADPQALSGALLRLMESKSLRRDLGAGGRETVTRRHDPAMVLGQWVDVLRKVARTA